MPESNPAFGKIIRGDFHCHPIAGRNPDKMLTHLARYMSEQLVIVLQANPVHRCRQHLYDGTLYFYGLTFWHMLPFPFVPIGLRADYLEPSHNASGDFSGATRAPLYALSPR